jgi:hypothetical protein
MYHLVYKTTCLINNKIYIGCHSTINLNDNYLGSGTLLKKAIKKYGKENFIREFILVCESRNEAYRKEKEIVNEDFISREDNYNMKIGGEGGFGFVNSRIKLDKEYKEKIYNKISESIKNLYKEGKLKGWKSVMKNNWISPFKGMNHSDLTKIKMSESKKGILNPSSLSLDVIEKRKLDLLEINKKYGYISFLSKKWNISHTQVKRFIEKYN